MKPKKSKSKTYDILGGGSKPRKGRYVGPGEGRAKSTTKVTATGPKVKHVSETQPKPKVVRRAKVQKSGYDPLGGQRDPKKPKPQVTKVRPTQQPPKQRQITDLKKWLASERTRMNKEMLKKSRERAARIAAAAKKK